jgi:multisubunit Na+/H+ antiporter MnhB subunit
MICAAIAAVEMRDLISSVIALSAVGLGLCLAFLLLKAPSLAVTQLVVEILFVIVLIRGTINKDLPLAKDGRWLFNTLSTFGFIACFIFFSYFALKELPVFGQPLMKVSSGYIARAARETGSDNIITAITTNYRLMDAVAEAAVLFGAILGVSAIARRIGRVHEK